MIHCPVCMRNFRHVFFFFVWSCYHIWQKYFHNEFVVRFKCSEHPSAILYVSFLIIAIFRLFSCNRKRKVKSTCSFLKIKQSTYYDACYRTVTIMLTRFFKFRTAVLLVSCFSNKKKDLLSLRVAVCWVRCCFFFKFA
jgi:hypothetical protein